MQLQHGCMWDCKYFVIGWSAELSLFDGDRQHRCKYVRRPLTQDMRHHLQRLSRKYYPWIMLAWTGTCAETVYLYFFCIFRCGVHKSNDEAFVAGSYGKITENKV